MPAGFYNGTTMFCDNVSFDGTERPGKVTADGQLMIGSSVAPNIRIGTISSSNGSIIITNGNGTINLQSATSGTVTNVLTANATPQFTVVGTTSTVDFALNNLVLGSSLPALTTGIRNVGLGSTNLSSITSGSYNTALGFESLKNVTIGNFNNAIGRASLFALTTGQYNVANGYSAGSGITTGTQNVLIGDSTGLSYTSSETGNILLGHDVRGVLGESYVTRIGNAGNGGAQPQTSCYIDGIATVVVANKQMVTINSATGQMGSQAIAAAGVSSINGDSGSATGSTLTLFANNATNNAGSTVKFVNSGSTSTFNVTDASSNTFIGLLAGKSGLTGIDNTGIGYLALNAITSAQYNVAAGSNAGKSITTGQGNVAIGWNALSGNVSSGFNVCVGMQAGQSITGQANIAIGYQSMFSGGTATNSIYLGYQNGFSITSGSGNVSLGILSLNALTSGSSNTVIGNQAGQSLTGATSNCILLGNGVAGSNVNNETIIGTGQTKCTISGIASVVVANAQMVTVNTATGQLGSQAIAASGGFAPEFKTGAVVVSNQTAVTTPFVAASPSGVLVGTINVQNTQMYLVPIYIDEAKTFTNMGCLVTTAPGVGSTIDFVLYDNTGVGGLPGLLVASAVNVSSTIVSITEGPISANLAIGWYFIGIQRNVVATVTIRGYGNADNYGSLTNKMFYNPSNPTTTNFQTISYFGSTNTYGTYPNNPLLTQNQPSNTIPLIYIR